MCGATEKFFKFILKFSILAILYLAARKSRMLELLAFDKKSTFETSAFFMRINRGSLYTHLERE